MVVDRSTQKQAAVVLQCEGIRTTGAICDRESEVTFPAVDPDSGKPLTAAQRKARARVIAREKGWQAPRGFDECPRVHGFMPTVKADLP